MAKPDSIHRRQSSAARRDLLRVVLAVARFKMSRTSVLGSLSASVLKVPL